MKPSEDDAKLRDPENWIPANRKSFPLFEIACDWYVSVEHLWNLIKEKEIAVPQENIERASSRAAIQVPRESWVDFLRRRSRLRKKTHGKDRK
jgi:hypothetical protein